MTVIRPDRSAFASVPREDRVIWAKAAVMLDGMHLDFAIHEPDLDRARLAAIADDAANHVAGALGVVYAGRVHVVVGAESNSAVGDELRIALRAEGRGYTRYDWFELLFSHELTHLLVRASWGIPAVLWWEGLPVHLGDDRVRTRLFGHSYHAHCHALAELECLLPLASLARASTYYRRRRDPRVDLQAGSFCGYLLARSRDRLGTLVAASRPVTSDLVDLELAALEAQWIEFLRHEVVREAALVERYRGRRFGSEPDGRAHCDVCYAPDCHAHA